MVDNKGDPSDHRGAQRFPAHFKVSVMCRDWDGRQNQETDDTNHDY